MEKRRGRPGSRGPLGYGVEEAGALIGLGKNAAYEAVRNGDIPAARVGNIWIVPKGAFHAKFGELPENEI
jgi:excisionase family DNA binding protein